jgi:hypothetical protein
LIFNKLEVTQIVSEGILVYLTCAFELLSGDSDFYSSIQSDAILFLMLLGSFLAQPLLMDTSTTLSGLVKYHKIQTTHGQKHIRKRSAGVL